MKENVNGKIKSEEEELQEETTTINEQGECEEIVSEITLEECYEVIKNLQSDLEQVHKEKEEIINHTQRLQAEFDNYRKRTRKEREEIIKNANAALIENILPIIDNFDRALQAGNEEFGESSFYEGIKMIYNGMFGVLEKADLQLIDAVGCDFDPEKHQAVIQVEACSEYPDNIVVEELQKGYLLNDKVLRPAMVKVAKDN